MTGRAVSARAVRRAALRSIAPWCSGAPTGRHGGAAGREAPRGCRGRAGRARSRLRLLGRGPARGRQARTPAAGGPVALHGTPGLSLRRRARQPRLRTGDRRHRGDHAGRAAAAPRHLRPALPAAPPATTAARRRPRCGCSTGSTRSSIHGATGRHRGRAVHGRTGGQAARASERIADRAGGRIRRFLARCPVGLLDEPQLVDPAAPPGHPHAGRLRRAVRRGGAGSLRRARERGCTPWPRGRDSRAVVPRIPPKDLDASVDFEPPLDRIDQVAFGVRASADRFIDGLRRGETGLHGHPGGGGVGGGRDLRARLAASALLHRGGCRRPGALAAAGRRQRATAASASAHHRGCGSRRRASTPSATTRRGSGARGRTSGSTTGSPGCRACSATAGCSPRRSVAGGALADRCELTAWGDPAVSPTGRRRGRGRGPARALPRDGVPAPRPGLRGDGDGRTARAGCSAGRSPASRRASPPRILRVIPVRSGAGRARGRSMSAGGMPTRLAGRPGSRWSTSTACPGCSCSRAARGGRKRGTTDGLEQPADSLGRVRAQALRPSGRR